MALTRTITFPNKPIPRTSRISCYFFLFADGGCAITFWKTSEAFRCSCVDGIQIGDYALSRISGSDFGRVGHGGRRCANGDGLLGGEVMGEEKSRESQLAKPTMEHCQKAVSVSATTRRRTGPTKIATTI